MYGSTGAPQLDSRLLGSKLGADFNITTDQAISISGTTKYVVRKIIVTNASISLTLAAGGFYATAAKVNALVAAAQVYSALTTTSKYLDCTLTALALSDVRTEATLFLSLTTGQGAAATADIYIYGDVLV